MSTFASASPGLVDIIVFVVQAVQSRAQLPPTAHARTDSSDLIDQAIRTQCALR